MCCSTSDISQNHGSFSSHNKIKMKYVTGEQNTCDVARKREMGIVLLTDVGTEYTVGIEWGIAVIKFF